MLVGQWIGALILGGVLIKYYLAPTNKKKLELEVASAAQKYATSVTLELDKVRTQNSALQDKLNEHSEKLVQIANENEVLNAEFIKLEQLNQQYREQLEKTNREFQERTATLEREKAEIIAKHHELLADYNKLSKKLEGYEQLRADYSTLKKDHDELRKEYENSAEAAQKRIEELERKIAKGKKIDG